MLVLCFLYFLLSAPPVGAVPTQALLGPLSFDEIDVVIIIQVPGWRTPDALHGPAVMESYLA